MAGWLMSSEWIGKHMERSCLGQIKLLYYHLPGYTKEKLSVKLVSGLKFEPGTSRIQSNIAIQRIMNIEKLKRPVNVENDRKT
jgi:hypothetical protein